MMKLIHLCAFKYEFGNLKLLCEEWEADIICAPLDSDQAK